MRNAIALGAGIVFSLGLGLGGMTQPAKIIGFLDVAGAWDPSLVFVLAGAVGTSMLAYRWIRRQRHPVLAPAFQIPRQRLIDGRLVLGSLLFGTGWGISGYCPGPAITSLVSGQTVAVGFVAAMLAGVALFDLTPLGKPWLGLRRRRSAAPTPEVVAEAVSGVADA